MYVLVSMAGPIIESKDVRAMFQKKCKEILKKGKIFENLGENVQSFKMF